MCVCGLCAKSPIYFGSMEYGFTSNVYLESPTSSGLWNRNESMIYWDPLYFVDILIWKDFCGQCPLNEENPNSITLSVVIHFIVGSGPRLGAQINFVHPPTAFSIKTNTDVFKVGFYPFSYEFLGLLV